MYRHNVNSKKDAGTILFSIFKHNIDLLKSFYQHILQKICS